MSARDEFEKAGKAIGLSDNDFTHTGEVYCHNSIEAGFQWFLSGLELAAKVCDDQSDEYMLIYSKTQDSTVFAVAGGLLKGAEEIRKLKDGE